MPVYSSTCIVEVFSLTLIRFCILWEGPLILFLYCYNCFIGILPFYTCILQHLLMLYKSPVFITNYHKNDDF